MDEGERQSVFDPERHWYHKGKEDAYHRVRQDILDSRDDEGGIARLLRSRLGAVMLAITLFSSGWGTALVFQDYASKEDVRLLELQVRGLRMDDCQKDGSTYWECRTKIDREDESYRRRLDYRAPPTGWLSDVLHIARRERP